MQLETERLFLREMTPDVGNTLSFAYAVTRREWEDLEKTRPTVGAVTAGNPAAPDNLKDAQED